MKSWTEKLHSSKPHVVKPVPKNIAGMKAGQMMLIPSAQLLDAFIRTIPSGSSMDVKTLRSELAARHDAEVSCPITTGILLRIVAEAAFDQHNEGASLEEIAPVWRVLDTNTPTLKKLREPNFILEQRAREELD